MKKMVSIISIFLVLFLLAFSINIYAASLDSIDVTTNKNTVHPGDTITLNIAFGTELGAYTVDVAYDNNLLEYVSATGGTANDNGTRIRVVYYYNEFSGESPSSSMSVTFKAKENIITSNPTDLSITAEGLANSDNSVNYDDITTPIVKNIVVEPAYIDYNIALNYTGDIIKNEEKDMKIVISSSMGKSYEHTRIIAEATTPYGETVNLFATDEQSLEHDIIQSGWGDASGDPIGGKDVVKELAVRGLFSGAGNYSITLKLIDRDNSDAEIASKTFDLTVKEQATTTTPEETENNNNQVVGNTEENEIENTENIEKPATLPKTGNTVYFAIIPIIAILIASYVYLKKKEHKL